MKIYMGAWWSFRCERCSFKVNVFAQGLGNARMLAVTDDGAVLVTRMAEGKVTLL